MSATKFLLSIILLLLLLALAFPNGVGGAFSNVQEREATIADIVMRSREVAPAREAKSDAPTYMIVVLAAIVLVGGAILFMYFGADFLKQWRLTRKAARRRSSPPRPQVLQPLPQLRQLPMVQEIDRGQG